MKRSFVTAVMLLFLFPFMGKAQDVNVFEDESINNYITVNMGLSIPAGNYGTYKRLETSGFASPGPGIMAEGVFFFSNYFGIGARGSYNRHFIAQKKWQELMYQRIPQEATYTVEAKGNYEIAAFQVGIFTGMKLNSWLQLNGKAMYGPHFVWIPELIFSYYHEYEFNNQTLIDDWKVHNNAGFSWQFGYLAGMGVTFTPSRGLSFTLNLDYANSHQAFQLISNTQGVWHDEIGNPQVGAGEERYSYEDNYRYLLLSGGIAILF